MCGQTCKTRRGFTLAEIVIAVAIIGTLATLTINTYFVDGNSQKSQYVAGLKKVYAEFSYATDQLKTGNSGTLSVWFNNFNDPRDIVNQYCKFLKCSKTCTDGRAYLDGCWHQGSSDMKVLNNAVVPYDTNSLTGTGGFILSDGSLALVEYAGSNCNTDYLTFEPNVCGAIHVDVNGSKGPNTYGRDIFMFAIIAKGIVPFGSTTSGAASNYNTYCNPASADSFNGIGCAGRVLQEGKMLY